jgi:hypothetical protein
MQWVLAHKTSGLTRSYVTNALPFQNLLQVYVRSIGGALGRPSTGEAAVFVRSIRLNIVVSLLFVLLLGACGGLGGCGGCGGGPLPAGGVPVSQTVEGGAQNRITPSGFTKLKSIVPALVRSLRSGSTRADDLPHRVSAQGWRLVQGSVRVDQAGRQERRRCRDAGRACRGGGCAGCRRVDARCGSEQRWRK